MSHVSSVPLFWRLRKSRYMLLGSKCYSCNSYFFPPRTLCPACRRKGDIKEYRFTGKGVIETFTIIHAAPVGFEEAAPYAVAIIRLDEGPRISGQVVGNLEGLDIGKRVRPVFRKMYEDGNEGLIHYGTKWEMEKAEKPNGT